MDIGIAEQIFTYVALFWLGLMGMMIPVSLMKRWIYSS